MRKFFLIATILAVFSQKTFADAGTPDALTVYNTLIERTNEVKKTVSVWTSTSVYAPENSKLLLALEDVLKSGKTTSAEIDRMMKKYPDFKVDLQVFKEHVDDLEKSFGYNEKKKALLGGSSPRESLLIMKLNMLSDDYESWILQLDYQLMKFAKKYGITVPEREPEEISRMKRTNGAIKYKQKLDVIVQEAIIYTNEFIEASGNNDLQGMDAARKELVGKLPALQEDLRKVADFEGQKNLVTQANSILGFINAFSNNAMVTQIGLMKKISEERATEEDVKKYNSFVDVINNKYAPMIDTFNTAQTEFLKQFVPPPPAR
jgi:hypothetical protein